MNQITLIGNVGRAPELSYTEGGVAIAKFTLATNYKRQGEQETTWHNIVAFGKQAETLNEYVGRGSKLFVQGRLVKREYTDKTGEKRQWIEVAVTGFEFLTTVSRAKGDALEQEAAGESTQENDESPF
jgi:single-strand DNA-binding protein